MSPTSRAMWLNPMSLARPAMAPLSTRPQRLATLEVRKGLSIRFPRARLRRAFPSRSGRSFGIFLYSLPLQRTLPHGVEEGKDYPEPDKDVEDGEDLAHAGRRVEVAVTYGGERCYAEVKRVEQTP